MIGKITKGRGFRGLAEYLLRGGRGEIVAGPMAGRTPRELASEFGRLRQLNPKLGKAVAHFSLSASPEDGPLSEHDWEAISERFMGDMGFADAPWCAVVHRDTDHQHVHVMACRIDMNGKTISDASDFRRAETAIRRIEAEFGLVVVASPKRGRPHQQADTPAPTPQGASAMPHPASPSGQSGPVNGPSKIEPAPFAPDQAIADLTLADPALASDVAGASCADVLVPRKRRDLRRIVVHDAYSARLLALFGEELVWVFKHQAGAVLYFKGPGRIADRGDKLTVLGPMPEREAARRVVALAISPERGWKSITFAGSSTFVELAMREALRHGLVINAVGHAQAQILAKLMAEKRGGLGAMAGPSWAADPLDGLLSWLDEEHPDTAPAPRPRFSAPAAPVIEDEPEALSPSEPVVGVQPLFLTLGERLRYRRGQRPRSHANGPQTAPIKPRHPRP